MKKKFLIAIILLLLISSSSYADVFPFEEEYGVETTQASSTVDEGTGFSVRQTEVTREDREAARRAIDEENRRDSYLAYRTITWKNFGQVMANLGKGIGLLYHDLFTRALPEYGADLASIPSGSAALFGKFVEIERKAVFEHDAKEKDIQAYIEAQQKPLTPEEERLLKELRNKPISPTAK